MNQWINQSGHRQMKSVESLPTEDHYPCPGASRWCVFPSPWLQFLPVVPCESSEKRPEFLWYYRWCGFGMLRRAIPCEMRCWSCPRRDSNGAFLSPPLQQHRGLIFLENKHIHRWKSLQWVRNDQRLIGIVLSRLHSLGNYTRRAIFPEVGKINQSSVDFWL